MKKMWRKIFTTAALACLLCLTGLAISDEAHAQRFLDNGNGTVTDTRTRLVWVKNPDQFPKMNWFDAETACSSASVGGIGGWRLPTMQELIELVTAIQSESPFSKVRPVYWSSSISPDSDDEAAFVTSSGLTLHAPKRSYYFSVWPVR
ncbi:Lcl C-terminal domain-containing protein [Desulfonatronum thiodismutans]|uniref:Lcl C-terminal domain-containing protein n=1 Tax=Desulfonatronum thiodismutans TaxID=159290 RepID=UPI0004ABD8E0|nr:DUF1566 domain-containing protein [Desulfonatronum thiodismutans]